ncbi:ABC transporter substrate-binding protein [Sphingomonas koreensis]|nr:ABC transporter substrate-binding protein [Sphingomonas koreensis]
MRGAAISFGFGLLGLMLLAGCAPPRGGSGGIVSTNPCADAMLVELAPADRIAAISHYSQEPAATSIPIALAKRFRATSGTAEEVIALHPDLVVTSSFTPRATRDAYARAGLKVLTLDSPTSVAASEAQVMQVAEAIGLRARGIAMVRRIEIALAKAAPAPGDAARPSALLYLSGNLASGGGTLLDELMRRAGLRDAAADYGLQHTGTLPLETIIDAPPDVILMPDLSDRPAALRASVLQYRSRLALFPRRLGNCGGPVIGPAVETLASIRRQVTP